MTVHVGTLEGAHIVGPAATALRNATAEAVQRAARAVLGLFLENGNASELVRETRDNFYEEWDRLNGPLDLR